MLLQRLAQSSNTSGTCSGYSWKQVSRQQQGHGHQPARPNPQDANAKAIEEGEERIVVLKDKTRLFSYRLDGKDLTVVFSEHLQAEFNEKVFNLPETVSLKSKAKR